VPKYKILQIWSTVQNDHCTRYCISLKMHVLFKTTAAQKRTDHVISEALWQFPVTRTIHITSKKSVLKGCIELCSNGSYGHLHASFLVLHLPHCNCINIFMAFCSFSETPFPSLPPVGKTTVTLYLEPPYIQPFTVQHPGLWNEHQCKNICQTYFCSRSLKRLEPERSLQLWFPGKRFTIIMKVFVNCLLEHALQQTDSSLAYRNVSDINSKDYHLVLPVYKMASWIQC
jgi:hypothetical protein